MIQKDTISYEDFLKLDIRVGTVIEAENVENSDKLLRLIVDFGELGTRQILTGMQQWYTPQDFIGMQTTFLLNLEPRKMMGLESQGMIIAVGLDHSQKPVFLKLAEDVKNGEGIS